MLKKKERKEFTNWSDSIIQCELPLIVRKKIV